MSEPYDLIIIGAGPAGTSAALYAAPLGLKVLLLDKKSFPRDKICGDALSGKAMEVLRDLGLADEAQKLPGAHIHSVVFGSPKGVVTDIAMKSARADGIPTGLVVPRKIFDAFLFEKASQTSAQIITGFEVKDILEEGGQVCGVSGINRNSGREEEYRGKIVLGADGYHALIARKKRLHERNPDHWIAAVRAYYKNVSGLDHQIELHFVDEIIPGYFWLFPAGENLANVGLGIVQSALQKRPFNLKKAMDTIIKSEAFASRFEQAAAVSKTEGWNLPAASMHRKNYGNGFMLLGDAAGLIDPFTGEGIGNAMVSGKHAAETASKAVQAGRYDAEMLSEYDRALWNHIGAEARTSALLQKIGRNKTLLNMVIHKAAGSAHVRETLSGMMANTIPRKKLTNPLFYLKLLFS